MRTFQVKCKVSNQNDFEYLWNASTECSDYYNSMLNTLRIDFEIKSQWPKECRKYISNYDLQKLYSVKSLGFKPKFLLAVQIISCADRLFDSIKSFYSSKKSNPNTKFPFKEKKFDKFNPLSFSLCGGSKNLKILNNREIELSFQHHHKITLKCRYNKKKELSKLNFRSEGHKLIFEDGEFYFHFCTETLEENRTPTNKSIFIDLGQIDLVTGFCPETKSTIKVSGKQLVNRKLTKKKEIIQSLIDKKKRNSIKSRKLKRTFKRLQRKETNQKRTFLHKVSRKLVNEYDNIIVGDLKGIKENTKSFSKTVNKFKFQFWPVALFVDMIDYKVPKSSNRAFIKQDESYTTKKCCVCGHLKNVTLSERIYKCDNCSNIISRDSNAAINIFDKFMQFEPKLFNSTQIQKRIELIGALRIQTLKVL